MGSGAYLATKSEGELYEAQIAREEREIEEDPEEERHELELFYQLKGLSEAEAKLLADRMALNPKMMLEAMATEELELAPSHHGNPVQAAIAALISTGVGAVIPVVPFLFIGHGRGDRRRHRLLGRALRCWRREGPRHAAQLVGLRPGDDDCGRDRRRRHLRRRAPLPRVLMPNRLAGETSPYLLQHAGNPVDWYPWGEEALKKARLDDKPIFLSVGYSACHWCHVMERESFEDESTAALLNRDFVSIKVDREERPDLDSIYMSAVQQMTGSGGWPMSVFLTPGLKPFFGGTYFPPDARYGMPGFPEVLTRVADAFRERRAEVERSGEQIAQAISQVVGGNRSRGASDRSILDVAAQTLKRQHDPVQGGFGGAPKFPQAMALDFLLRSWRRTGDEGLLAAVEKSLVDMAHGGIWDHLGGGFARYSTDAHWLVPHFEKMLYDQALLATVYTHAFQATGRTGYRAAASRIIEYVLRDLAAPDGGFYSSEDADSEGEEGRFYTWTFAAAQDACGADFDIARLTFGITSEGNWEGTNILHVAADRRTVPDELGISEDEYREGVARARERMFAARELRVRPARDDKVLAGWNGLMLSAIAEAAVAFGRADFLAAGQKNAAFLLDRLYRKRGLLRSFRDGEARVPAYLEDYGAVATGLLHLYQADFSPRWFEAARELGEDILAHFSDPDGGLFYSTSEVHQDLLYRPKDYDDNAVPAGNSLAAEALLTLSLLTGDDRYRSAAVAAIGALGGTLASHPLFFGRLLSVLDTHLGDPIEVAVIGDPDATGTQALLARVRQGYEPNRVVALGPPGTTAPELLRDRAAPAGAAVYVCRGFICARPAETLEDLDAQLMTTTPGAAASPRPGVAG